MKRRLARFVGAIGALCAAAAGCESWDPSIRARERAQETWACESVELTQTEENRWHAIGCGHEGDFACTAGALEPTCIQVRTAGGEHPRDEEEEALEARAPEGLDESEAALWARAQHEDPDLDPRADEGEAEAVPPPPPSATTATPASPEAEAAIRAGLDARRADVFACTQHDPTVVRVTYAADGTLEIHLAGGLAGSAEEGCVRAALSGVRAPESATGGAVLHLIHAPR
ncbi:MAG: hypothetical protein U0234_06890 [Sandaracinus sp.]